MSIYLLYIDFTGKIISVICETSQVDFTDPLDTGCFCSAILCKYVLFKFLFCLVHYCTLPLIHLAAHTHRGMLCCMLIIILDCLSLSLSGLRLQVGGKTFGSPIYLMRDRACKYEHRSMNNFKLKITCILLCFCGNLVGERYTPAGMMRGVLNCETVHLNRGLSYIHAR